MTHRCKTIFLPLDLNGLQVRSNRFYLEFESIGQVRVNYVSISSV